MNIKEFADSYPPDKTFRQFVWKKHLEESRKGYNLSPRCIVAREFVTAGRQGLKDFSIYFDNLITEAARRNQSGVSLTGDAIHQAMQNYTALFLGCAIESLEQAFITGRFDGELFATLHNNALVGVQTLDMEGQGRIGEIELTGERFEEIPVGQAHAFAIENPTFSPLFREEGITYLPSGLKQIIGAHRLHFFLYDFVLPAYEARARAAILGI